MRFNNVVCSALILVFALFFSCGTSYASAKYPKGVWQCDPTQLEAYNKVPEDVRKQWLDINDFHDEYTLTRLYGNIGDIWVHLDYVAKKEDKNEFSSYFGDSYTYSVPDASIHFSGTNVNGIKLNGTFTQVKITENGLIFLGETDGGTGLQIYVFAPDFFNKLNGDAPIKFKIGIVPQNAQPVEVPGEGFLHKLEWHYVLPKK